MSRRTDRAAEEFLVTWEYYARLNPDGLARNVGGTRACVTGVPVPTLNGVYVATESVEPAVVTTLLDELSTSGVPYCLQGRPASVETLAEVARLGGLVRAEDAPLMVLDDPSRLAVTPAMPQLVVRELDAAQRHLHLEVAAAGFGAPRELIDRLVPPQLLAGAGVRVYAGLIDGRAVTTGLAIALADTVGVFNVATVPGFRRHGYGGAVTARLVADGFAAGASLACLQSSAEGYPMYERLGFETIERWPCWITPASGG